MIVCNHYMCSYDLTKWLDFTEVVGAAMAVVVVAEIITEMVVALVQIGTPMVETDHAHIENFSSELFMY